jgi:hypothetical protein
VIAAPLNLLDSIFMESRGGFARDIFLDIIRMTAFAEMQKTRELFFVSSREMKKIFSAKIF